MPAQILLHVLSSLPIHTFFFFNTPYLMYQTSTRITGLGIKSDECDPINL